MVELKLNNLLELRLRGDISDEDYTNKKSELQKSRDLLQFHLDENSSKIEKSQEATIDLLNFARHAKEKFLNGCMEDKRSILSIVGSNLMLFDRKLLIEPEKPIFLLENLASEVKPESDQNSRLEPLQVPIKKRDLQRF